ncbi:hypothetical protein ACFV1L_21095 [Kitasatospora sp. NPDC059646]|uniref:hypothetical protein n=1 Tax=Kitasatospora sp. NPDC059646 TaxID=3346893 RepID=UPI00369A56FA
MSSTPYFRPGTNPVVWVTEAYPAVLCAVLNRYEGGLPREVPEIIWEQIQQGDRTPAQLRNRVEQRWFLRYSNLTRSELRERADEIAIALVAPSKCPNPDCEDGVLLTSARTCGRCLPARSEFHMRAEDVPDGRRSSPAAVAGAAAAIRARMRQVNGFPRDRRSLPGVPVAPKRKPGTYVPAPYTLREPEVLPEDERVYEAAPRWRLREDETVHPNTWSAASPSPSES